MSVLLLVLLLVGVVAVTVAVLRRRDGGAADVEPADPLLDEILVRPSAGGDRRVRAARSAMAAAAPHVRRALEESGSNPVLAVYSNYGEDVLVVTTDQTLLVDRQRMLAVDHRPGTRTACGARPPVVGTVVEVDGPSGSLRFVADLPQEARRICRAIDVWAENPTVRHHPAVLITPHRVHVPEQFFVDTLRAAGHPVTPGNLRSLHERFGMQMLHKARKLIDGRDLAAGERFTARHGRPADVDLPGWTERVLTALLHHDPTLADMMTAALCQTRELLLESPYLADRSRPLCMWQSDRYTDGGTGAPRPEFGGHPGVPA